MKYIYKLFICLAICFAIPLSGYASDLKQQIKNCNSKDCLKSLEQEAQEIHNQVGQNFNDDFASIGNEIVGRHCRSIIQEIIYHLKTLEDYSNFKNVFYYEKLKKLKEARKKFENRKLGQADFERISKQLEIQYKEDLKDSQEFVNDKVFRLKELRTSIESNVNDIKSTASMGKTLLPSIRESILSLRSDTVWNAFENDLPKGKRIKEAIRQSTTSGSSDELIANLMGIFSLFESSDAGNVFSESLIQTLKEHNPI